MARLLIKAKIESKNKEEVRLRNTFSEVVKVVGSNATFRSCFIAEYNNWCQKIQSNITFLNGSHQFFSNQVSPSAVQRFLVTAYVAICFLESIRSKNKDCLLTGIFFCSLLAVMSLSTTIIGLLSATPNKSIKSIFNFVSIINLVSKDISHRLNRTRREFKINATPDILYTISRDTTYLRLSRWSFFFQLLFFNFLSWFNIYGTVFAVQVCVILKVLSFMEELDEVLKSFSLIMLFINAIIQDIKIRKVQKEMHYQSYCLAAETEKFLTWFRDNSKLDELLEQYEFIKESVFNIFSCENDIKKVTSSQSSILFAIVVIKTSNGLADSINSENFQNILQFLLFNDPNADSNTKVQLISDKNLDIPSLLQTKNDLANCMLQVGTVLKESNLASSITAETTEGNKSLPIVPKVLNLKKTPPVEEKSSKKYLKNPKRISKIPLSKNASEYVKQVSIRNKEIRLGETSDRERHMKEKEKRQSIIETTSKVTKGKNFDPEKDTLSTSLDGPSSSVLITRESSNLGSEPEVNNEGTVLNEHDKKVESLGMTECFKVQNDSLNCNDYDTKYITQKNVYQQSLEDSGKPSEEISETVVGSRHKQRKRKTISENNDELEPLTMPISDSKDNIDSTDVKFAAASNKMSNSVEVSTEDHKSIDYDQYICSSLLSMMRRLSIESQKQENDASNNQNNFTIVKEGNNINNNSNIFSLGSTDLLKVDSEKENPSNKNFEGSRLQSDDRIKEAGYSDCQEFHIKDLSKQIIGQNGKENENLSNNKSNIFKCEPMKLSTKDSKKEKVSDENFSIQKSKLEEERIEVSKEVKKEANHDSSEISHNSDNKTFINTNSKEESGILGKNKKKEQTSRDKTLRFYQNKSLSKKAENSTCCNETIIEPRSVSQAILFTSETVSENQAAQNQKNFYTGYKASKLEKDKLADGIAKESCDSQQDKYILIDNKSSIQVENQFWPVKEDKLCRSNERKQIKDDEKERCRKKENESTVDKQDRFPISHENNISGQNENIYSNHQENRVFNNTEHEFYNSKGNQPCSVKGKVSQDEKQNEYCAVEDYGTCCDEENLSSSHQGNQISSNIEICNDPLNPNDENEKVSSDNKQNEAFTIEDQKSYGDGENVPCSDQEYKMSSSNETYNDDVNNLDDENEKTSSDNKQNETSAIEDQESYDDEENVPCSDQEYKMSSSNETYNDDVNNLDDENEKTSSDNKQNETSAIEDQESYDDEENLPCSDQEYKISSSNETYNDDVNNLDDENEKTSSDNKQNETSAIEDQESYGDVENVPCSDQEYKISSSNETYNHDLNNLDDENEKKSTDNKQNETFAIEDQEFYDDEENVPCRDQENLISSSNETCNADLNNLHGGKEKLLPNDNRNETINYKEAEFCDAKEIIPYCDQGNKIFNNNEICIDDEKNPDSENEMMSPDIKQIKTFETIEHHDSSDDKENVPCNEQGNQISSNNGICNNELNNNNDENERGCPDNKENETFDVEHHDSSDDKENVPCNEKGNQISSNNRICNNELNNPNDENEEVCPDNKENETSADKNDESFKDEENILCNDQRNQISNNSEICNNELYNRNDEDEKISSDNKQNETSVDENDESFKDEEYILCNDQINQISNNSEICSYELNNFNNENHKVSSDNKQNETFNVEVHDSCDGKEQIPCNDQGNPISFNNEICNNVLYNPNDEDEKASPDNKQKETSADENDESFKDEENIFCCEQGNQTSSNNEISGDKLNNLSNENDKFPLDSKPTGTFNSKENESSSSKENTFWPSQLNRNFSDKQIKNFSAEENKPCIQENNSSSDYKQNGPFNIEENSLCTGQDKENEIYISEGNVPYVSEENEPGNGLCNVQENRRCSDEEIEFYDAQESETCDIEFSKSCDTVQKDPNLSHEKYKPFLSEKNKTLSSETTSNINSSYINNQNALADKFDGCNFEKEPNKFKTNETTQSETEITNNSPCNFLDEMNGIKETTTSKFENGTAAFSDSELLSNDDRMASRQKGFTCIEEYEKIQEMQTYHSESSYGTLNPDNLNQSDIQSRKDCEQSNNFDDSGFCDNISDNNISQVNKNADLKQGFSSNENRCYIEHCTNFEEAADQFSEAGNEGAEYSKSSEPVELSPSESVELPLLEPDATKNFPTEHVQLPSSEPGELRISKTTDLITPEIEKMHPSEAAKLPTSKNSKFPPLKPAELSQSESEELLKLELAKSLPSKTAEFSASKPTELPPSKSVKSLPSESADLLESKFAKLPAAELVEPSPLEEFPSSVSAQLSPSELTKLPPECFVSKSVEVSASSLPTSEPTNSILQQISEMHPSEPKKLPASKYSKLPPSEPTEFPISKPKELPSLEFVKSAPSQSADLLESKFAKLSATEPAELVKSSASEPEELPLSVSAQLSPSEVSKLCQSELGKLPPESFASQSMEVSASKSTELSVSESAGLSTAELHRNDEYSSTRSEDAAYSLESWNINKSHRKKYRKKQKTPGRRSSGIKQYTSESNNSTHGRWDSDMGEKAAEKAICEESTAISEQNEIVLAQPDVYHIRNQPLVCSLRYNNLDVDIFQPLSRLKLKLGNQFRKDHNNSENNEMVTSEASSVNQNLNSEDDFTSETQSIDDSTDQNTSETTVSQASGVIPMSNDNRHFESRNVSLRCRPKRIANLKYSYSSDGQKISVKSKNTKLFIQIQNIDKK
ncbi:putative uncharacterized protein DDB_G0282133 [Argiope bruennichi]|uniref:putative uncharacterized protein DDB_G0282133 n=1 Tax=Argiope bruennichi TaxID=94029 RepID=UPI00249438D7|nr:putative uncharacterized protein DDB_G0282133 [Argiope bruennichi]